MSKVKVSDFTKAELKCFFQENILNRQAAREITKQSNTAFSQTVDRGKLKPFLTYGEGRASYHFFLREEVEEYARSMRSAKE